MLFQIQTNVDTAMVAMQDSLAVLDQPVQESINLFTMAQYGGWIMIVLALLLAFAVYLFIERLVVLTKGTDTPAAHMIEKGISRIGRPMQDVQVAIENVGNLEVSKLEKGLVLIATIAAGAPMLGFLGTVLGMVQTFFNMAQNASGVIEIATLSEGMYQAMVTTVGGLIVGILAMFAYNFLVSRVDRVVRQLESRTMEFMDLLNEPA